MSISAFNDAPLVPALLLLLLLGVSRLGVLGAAGRRFCCCRLLRTDDRGGNPRFDINLSTPLSERCSPSFANAAFSTAPLRNVKLLSLSTKVALFSSQVARSWSFNVFRRCISVVRRFVGMTLLSFTDGAADFAVRSRRLTSLLTSSAVASPMVSVVPPTMTISLIVCVLAASSIICSISLNVAPDFLTTRIWLLLTGPSKWTSRSKMLPTSSVSTLEFESIVSVIGLLVFSQSLRRSCCCSTTRATSCWLKTVNFSINDSRADVFSSKPTHRQLPT